MSFGTGGEGLLADRMESATSVAEDGYVVEVASSLPRGRRIRSFRGLDFQVHDASTVDGRGACRVVHRAEHR